MKKLLILTLVILVLAALICPPAVIADGAVVHTGRPNLEPTNLYQKDRSTTEPRNIAGQKLVCLTFDDGWQNQYDNALPILLQYGFKATFAVVTTWIGGGSGAGQAMSMDEIHQLANQGMDIASHTKTHPHLPTLNSSSLQNEVAGSKIELEQAGFTIKTFAYPYFEYNSTNIASVKNAGYICARSGALNKPFDPSSTNPDDRFTIDAVEINTQNITQFQTIVSQAGEHSVICLCYHSISDNISSPTPRTPVANFSEQMRYLKENGFTVVLLPDLIQTPSSNWLTGWSYRKQITIAGSTTGAQTNYQMKLTINRSTGTDSGATVYVGTKCASDYKDIRFTKADGITLLDYWVESSDSTAATVWVELDSIPTSPGTANFYLYYGNSGATSSSNIQTTFVFGDDFGDGALDTTKWITGGGSGGSITEANGSLTVTAGSANQKYAASIVNYRNEYALHARAKLDSITGCSNYRFIGFSKSKGSTDTTLFTTTFRWFYTDASFIALSGDGTGTSYADMGIAVDTNYHISECRRYAVSGTNYDRFIIDGGPAVTGVNPSSTARYIYIQSNEPGKAVIVDWIFLRKFASPEPAWGTWGGEETRG